jgi:regulatory protein
VLKLRARGCPDPIITQVVDALTEEGIQSDVKFAESFVRSRIDRGTGPVRVRAELTVRGVDDDVIEAALAEYEDWWRDLAVEVYQKRYHGKPPENFNDKARRANFLQSRGFTHEQIRYALEHTDPEQPDSEI